MKTSKKKFKVAGRPWYVVGPSRKLMLTKRTGGWTLDAQVGKTWFSIYGDQFFTYQQGMMALKDAEAYVREADVMSCTEHKRLLDAANKSKKRYYSE